MNSYQKQHDLQVYAVCDALVALGTGKLVFGHCFTRPAILLFMVRCGSDLRNCKGLLDVQLHEVATKRVQLNCSGAGEVVEVDNVV